MWRDLPRVRAEAAAAAAESSTARAISSESDSWRYQALHWRLKTLMPTHSTRPVGRRHPPAPVDPYSFSIRDHRWVPPPSYRDYYRRGAWCEDASFARRATRVLQRRRSIRRRLQPRPIATRCGHGWARVRHLPRHRLCTSLPRSRAASSSDMHVLRAVSAALRIARAAGSLRRRALVARAAGRAVA